MQFIVLGAGAIGCYVGGRLAAAGEQVVLVGRPRIVDELATHGLTVTDLDGYRHHIDGADLRLASSLQMALQALPPAATGTPEPERVVLLCVKGGATSAAGAELAEHCPAGTVVVSLQNGVDNVARLQQAAPGLQVLAGMVPYNVVMPKPGQVHRGTSGQLHMARHPVTQAMWPRLGRAGLPTVLSDDMRPVQWGKLLLNLNNPVNALSDLPLRQQLQQRDYRRALAALQTEALAIMARAGIRPAKVGSTPPRLLPHILRLPDWLFARLAARMLRMDASARSSMWEDIQHGRQTEIDDLCGAVVRLAQGLGLDAPRNRAMCGLIGQLHKGQRLGGRQLLQALQADAP